MNAHFSSIKSAWGIYGGKIAVLVMENFWQPNISRVVSTWLAGETLSWWYNGGFCRTATFSVIRAGGERGQILMGVWSWGATIELIIIRRVRAVSLQLCPTLSSPCCCSVTQSYLTLCKPMDCSPPGFPVLCHLPELAQTHVHWVNDAIQPSRPLLSPSPPTFNPSQHQGLFQWVSSSHQVAKVLELQLQHQSFQWIFRVDFLEDWLVWSPCSPRDFQESSSTPQFKSINCSALRFLYSPTLTSIHDYWKSLHDYFDFTDLCWQNNVSHF